MDACAGEVGRIFVVAAVVVVIPVRGLLGGWERDEGVARGEWRGLGEESMS